MGERKGQSKHSYQIFLPIGVFLRFVTLVYLNTWKESEQNTCTYMYRKKKMLRPKIQNQKLNYYGM